MLRYNCHVPRTAMGDADHVARVRLRLPHLRLVPGTPSVSRGAASPFPTTSRCETATFASISPFRNHRQIDRDRFSRGSHESTLPNATKFAKVGCRDGAPSFIFSTADLWSDFWGISDGFGFKVTAFVRISRWSACRSELQPRWIKILTALVVENLVRQIVGSE